MLWMIIANDIIMYCLIIEDIPMKPTWLEDIIACIKNNLLGGEQL